MCGPDSVTDLGGSVSKPNGWEMRGKKERTGAVEYQTLPFHIDCRHGKP